MLGNSVNAIWGDCEPEDYDYDDDEDYGMIIIPRHGKQYHDFETQKRW
jgi:hypothetical protein